VFRISLEGVDMRSEITCPNCGVFNKVKDQACWKCKRKITVEEKTAAESKDAERERAANLSEEEKNEIALSNAKQNGDWCSLPKEVLENEVKKIKITTSYQIANANIESEIDVITAEVVYGMNIFKDLFASVRDVVGGRSDAVQKILKDARKTVLYELKKEALILGADAIISIDLDYQELTGGGKNGMIMLVASGTAVSLEK
jgi:uncharacterized protein YbjQ (UPF0145 family)